MSLYNRLVDHARSWFFLIALLGVWQVAVDLFSIPRFLLPSIIDIGQAYIEDFESLAAGFLVTSLEAITSYIFSGVLGILLGVGIFKSHFLDRSVFPLLVIGQSIPVLAAAPLFVIWFGFDYTPKILIAVLITFFPILMGMVLGLRSTDPDVLLLAKSIGLGPRATFIKIELPGALPSLFGGLRVAATLVIVGVVVGEFVGSSAGLGYLVLRAAGTINTPLLFASLGLLVALGLLLSAAVTAAERQLMTWRFDDS